MNYLHESIGGKYLVELHFFCAFLEIFIILRIRKYFFIFLNLENVFLGPLLYLFCIFFQYFNSKISLKFEIFLEIFSNKKNTNLAIFSDKITENLQI